MMALLYVCGPTLLTSSSPSGTRFVPIFRLAILAIPLAALPLDGVMRARAQNRFVLAISVVKLAVTVPLVVAGFHLYGLRGAMGGWMAAEAATRGILLLRAGQLLGKRYVCLGARSRCRRSRLRRRRPSAGWCSASRKVRCCCAWSSAAPRRVSPTGGAARDGELPPCASGFPASDPWSRPTSLAA